MIKFIYYEDVCSGSCSGHAVILDHYDTTKNLVAVYNTETRKAITPEQYESWSNGRKCQDPLEVEHREAIRAPACLWNW